MAAGAIVASPDAEAPSSKGRVLAIGIYLADEPNTVAHVVRCLAGARRCDVVQRWIALGEAAVDEAVSAVTVRRVHTRTPKFQLVNELIADEDLAAYEYVLLVDDDVVFPDQFLDAFLSSQAALGFAIAQPARTSNSYIDLPIVEQQRGVRARETRFVEIGPVVSFSKSVYDLVFPFDLTSGMGWGYCYVWPYLLEQRGLTLGIIDSLPVDHSLRPPVTHYTWQEADRQRTVLLQRHPHLTREQAFTVLDTFGGNGSHPPRSRRLGVPKADPLISVVIATHDRADLLTAALESFTDQSIRPLQFEVIVVDDGSTDRTEKVCDEYLPRLGLRYFRIDHAGRAAAKNLGIFAATAPIVLLFDDDDEAHRDLLREHLVAHAERPEERIAILGYTCWSPTLEVTPVMEYVTEIGQYMFAYPSLQAGVELDFTHFWEGRISCKRSLLVNHGIHNQSLNYTIDIELAYRLSKFGLAVIYRPWAISYMSRGVTFEEFCRRCEAKGRAQWLISQLHQDPVMQQYCRVNEAEQWWTAAEPHLPDVVRRIRELEAALQPGTNEPAQDPLLSELRKLYRWAFDAFSYKGIVAAKAQHGVRP